MSKYIYVSKFCSSKNLLKVILKIQALFEIIQHFISRLLKITLILLILYSIHLPRINMSPISVNSFLSHLSSSNQFFQSFSPPRVGHPQRPPPPPPKVTSSPTLFPSFSFSTPTALNLTADNPTLRFYSSSSSSS